jgi:PAS domain S-box-containing protein
LIVVRPSGENRVTAADPSLYARIERAVARGLAQTSAPDEAYAIALAAIGVTLGWTFGAVWEADEARGVLTAVQTWRSDPAAAAALMAVTPTLALKPGAGLPGLVWKSGEPAWIQDMADDEQFPRAKAMAESGVRAAMCFPVRSNRGVVGAIEFFTEEWQEPDGRLLECMDSLGSQIGQFVERRRSDAAVRHSEARMRAMLAAALDCVIIIDAQGRVLEFNAAAERTFGYTSGEVAGREMADLIVPPSLRERHRRGLARYLETEQARVLDRRIEITGMRADASEFPAELTITRIDVDDAVLFTGYVRDITDRKRADAELRASRARIVEAADAERRRIERNLHDGAQQSLLGLALDLRLARKALGDGDGDGEATALLDEALEDLAEATKELRDLARGIHPSVLADHGLKAAFAMLAERAAIPVEIDAVPDERFEPSVEATAYYVAAEALTNVARYAEATGAWLEARTSGGRLTVAVVDDGRGGAEPGAGTGLRGLEDRVAALGGELAVVSPPGGGTTVTARIPCASS